MIPIFFLFEYYADTNQSLLIPREFAYYWGKHLFANYLIRLYFLIEQKLNLCVFNNFQSQKL